VFLETPQIAGACVTVFMNRPTVQRLIWLLLATAGVAVFAIVGVVWWSAREEVTIGVEGRRVIEFAGPELHAAPFTPGDALSVRIAGVEPTKNGFRYDLRFIAYGPGEHDLAEPLFLVDRAKPEGLPPLVVRVNSVLPADHKGDLYSTSPSAINLHSYYSPLMIAAWCGWGLLLIPLMLYGRPRAMQKSKPERVPTTKERLAALLNEASRERLPVE